MCKDQHVQKKEEMVEDLRYLGDVPHMAACLEILQYCNLKLGTG